MKMPRKTRKQEIMRLAKVHGAGGGVDDPVSILVAVS